MTASPLVLGAVAGGSLGSSLPGFGRHTAHSTTGSPVSTFSASDAGAGALRSLPDDAFLVLPEAVLGNVGSITLGGGEVVDQETWLAFQRLHSEARAATVAAARSNRGVGIPGMPSTRGAFYSFDSDDGGSDDEALLMQTPQGRAAEVLRQSDRLSGMFTTLRRSLSAMRVARNTMGTPVPGAPSAPGTAQGSGGDGESGGSVEDGAVGTAIESLPLHLRKSLLGSLLRAKTAAAALSIISAHLGDLSNLALPLVSHNSVSESQALKDANRDVLSLNGAVQPPGTDALAICATIVSMLNPLVRDTDAARIAAVNVLKSVSRTATGGDSFFAIKALLGDKVIITPSRVPKPSPVRIDISAEGRVRLEADNIFDIYGEDAFRSDDNDFGPAPTSGRLSDSNAQSLLGEDHEPQAWLRLRVVVVEEGSIVYTSRTRKLSILGLPC